MASTPILQTPRDFMSDFISEVNRAQHTVWLQTMVFESGTVTDLMVEALVSAAKRGVKVRFNLDWSSQRHVHGNMKLTPEFNVTNKEYGNRLHERNAVLLKQLLDAGVEIVEMNKPLIIGWYFPVYKRNHIKLFVVDNHVGWMGGVNLFDLSYDIYDFMVRFEQEEIVKAFAEQFVLVGDARPKSNYLIDCNNDYRFIVDAGKVGKSLIYEQALELAGSAERSIVFMSQLVPENRMLDLLVSKASDGIPVTVITSPRDDANFSEYPFVVTYKWLMRKIEGKDNISLIHCDKKVHAKLLIVDDREAIFGSHNLVETGVLMGTEEIAMRVKNTTLINQILDFVRSV